LVLVLVLVLVLGRLDEGASGKIRKPTRHRSIALGLEYEYEYEYEHQDRPEETGPGSDLFSCG